MQQKNRGLMKFLFGSSKAEPEPSRSEPSAAGPEAWAAAPEPEPHGSGTAAAAGDAAAAQQSAQAPAMAPNGATTQGMIPVPNIPADEPPQHSVPIPGRPVIIRGRSLCDVHSDEAVDHAERASSIKMGQTPPLLSMIRQTAMETREDGRR